MKNKKILKRNLAAIICAGMLYAPVLTSYSAAADTAANSTSSAEAADTEAKSEAVTQNPTVELNFKNDATDKEYKGLQFDLLAAVRDKDSDNCVYINCGRYDTENKSSIKVEIPADMYKIYSDENKYSITFYVEPANVSGECYFGNYAGFKYTGEENESYDAFLEIYESRIMKGSLTLIPPTKLEYKIGEELDFTGGSTRGSGSIESILSDPHGVWDDFGNPLSLKRLDAYDFDNSKPGEYVIRYKPTDSSSFDGYEVTVKPNEFTVTVVDGERPEGATAKISIVDADSAETVKGAKAVLFKTDRKTVAPDKDEIVTMWDTSKVPERLYTETDFDPDKYYYIGFENEADGYADEIRTYNRGYYFSTEKFFRFENDKENTDWIYTLKADDTQTLPDGTFNLRLYERYKGSWKDPINIGIIQIKDSEGKTAGMFPINKDFSLEDGDYSATINIFSKDYKCFSDETISFTVKDGKTETALDFNVERSDFSNVGNGDSNNDGTVDMSDVVLIMQSLSNPSKYGVEGTDEHHITEEGALRADIDGNGVTNNDALTIQEYLLGHFDIK